ncbi:MAG: signal peptidase II [Alphaproteobacteria bacterium]
MRSRLFNFLIVTVLAAVIDQAIKAAMVQLLAGAGPIALAPFLNLRLGYNTGVSFGMFAETFRERPWLLAAIMMGIVLLVAAFAIRAERRLDAFSFGLIAGGAVGNIVDRLRLGAVVDYIDLFYAGWRWPTFNLADSLISLGVALLVGTALFAPKRRMIGS